MTCRQCEYLVHTYNKRGYNLYYCGYNKKKLKAMCGAYIDDKPFLTNCKFKEGKNKKNDI